MFKFFIYHLVYDYLVKPLAPKIFWLLIWLVVFSILLSILSAFAASLG